MKLRCVVLIFVSVFFVVECRHCDNWLSCMNQDVYTNISNIIESDVYKISDRLYLEKMRDESENSQHLSTKMNAVSSYVLLKKVTSLFKTHALKYKLTKGLDLAVFRNVTEDGAKMAVALVTDEPQRGARTFGVAIFRKRMMYILLAMTFKLGIMTTLLVTILVLVLKGLKIGVLLLVLSFGSALAKWKVGGHAAPSWKKEDDGKGIHVHIHNDAAQKQAYSGWTEEQWRPPVTSYHRKKDGQVYSVNEDVGMGYPAVFRPPVYKSPPLISSYNEYIPVYPTGYSRNQERYSNHQEVDGRRSGKYDNRRREEDSYRRRSGEVEEDSYSGKVDEEDSYQRRSDVIEDEGQWYGGEVDTEQ